MQEIVPIKTVYGEERSWDIVCEMDHEEVSRRIDGVFDKETARYTLRCFGVDFLVEPCERRIMCQDPKGALFMETLKDFFRLSVLWYMTSAKDIPLTERFMRPVDIKGGHRFSQGTHVLPADKIAKRFASDTEGFIRQAERFGGHQVTGYGDAGVRLYPLPRVPVTFILWVEDEEFPPSVDIFFDSTVEFQLSLSDIVWSVAMLASLVMLEE